MTAVIAAVAALAGSAIGAGATYLVAEQQIHNQDQQDAATKTETAYRLALHWEADLINQLQTLALAPPGERAIRRPGLVNTLQRSDDVSIELLLHGSPAANDEFDSLFKSLSAISPDDYEAQHRAVMTENVKFANLIARELRVNG